MDEQLKTIYFQDGSYITFKFGQVQSDARLLELQSRLYLAMNPSFPWQEIISHMCNTDVYVNTKWASVINDHVDRQTDARGLEPAVNSVTQREEIKKCDKREDVSETRTKIKTKTKNKHKKRRVQHLKDAIRCIVCNNDRRQVVFVPCHHMCCCEACGEKIRDKCIVCNAQIQTKLKVYCP